MSDTLNDLRTKGREIGDLARAIRELAGDDDLAFFDTLDGETNALKAASGAVRMVSALNVLEDAAKALGNRYLARAKDFSDRSVRARDALAHFMGEIGEKTLVLPEGTLSLATGGVQLVGEPEVADLPEHLVRVTRAPDRAAIKAHLVAGGELPGLALSNARPQLRIRVR